MNLLAISANVVGLEVVMRFTSDIYKNRYLDVLESLFILNLGILAIAWHLSSGARRRKSDGSLLHICWHGICCFHCNNIVPCAPSTEGSKLSNALQYCFKHERRWVAIPTEDTMEENMHNSGFAPTVSFINLLLTYCRESSLCQPRVHLCTHIK